jgi:hypothetical protein
VQVEVEQHPVVSYRHQLGGQPNSDHRAHAKQRDQRATQQICDGGTALDLRRANPADRQVLNGSHSKEGAGSGEVPSEVRTKRATMQQIDDGEATADRG